MRFKRCYSVEDFEAGDRKYKRDHSIKFNRPKWYRKFPDCPWEEVRDPAKILELEGAYEEWCHEQAGRILEVITE